MELRNSTSICSLILGFTTLLLPSASTAQDAGVIQVDGSQSVAFARYLESTQLRNPFTESGPVAIVIEASLPRLYKQTRLLAIRQTGESERGQYQVLRIDGDATVAEEVIVRYLKEQEEIDSLPVTSIAITPANYKFRYHGEVGSGAGLAYIFQISPKKKGAGLIQGQIWINAATGEAVLQTGRLVRTPVAFTGRIEVVRDTTLVNGSPCVRVTHVSMETRRAGHGELTITEIPLEQASNDTPSRIIGYAGPGGR